MKCERCGRAIDRLGLTITDTYREQTVRFCSYLCRFIWHEEHFVEAVRYIRATARHHRRPDIWPGGLPAARKQ
jgi:hypothetical protein